MESEKSEVSPLDLIERFSRCQNYPRTVEGIQFLAQGLVHAQQTTGIEMEVIVGHCATISQYCPTDHELLNVARSIRDERLREAESRRDQTAEWERQYGPAKPYDWRSEAASIMPAAREYWRKDKQRIELMRKKAREGGFNLRKLSYPQWFALQVKCQREVGLPVTSEQEKELRRIS